MYTLKMKTFKFKRTSTMYEECIVQANTLKEAKKLSEKAAWDDSGPCNTTEQYKVVESSGDLYLDYDNLMDSDWIDL